jgi:hypothetical protein
MQGIPATKVADLAGHSLVVQQRIYKKYQLENDHSVLRRDDVTTKSAASPTSTNIDVPFEWEIDPETGEWFRDEFLEPEPD